MARQLQADGQHVARLVLLDAPAPGTSALLGMAEASPGYIHRLAAQWLGERWGVPPLDEAGLAGLDAQAVRERVVEHLRAAGDPDREPAQLRRHLDALDRVGTATGQALREYRPIGRLDGPTEVVLFACRDGMGGRFAEAGDYREGWQGLIAAPIQRIPVACDHFTLMRPPACDLVAAVLSALPDPQGAPWHPLPAKGNEVAAAQ
jgi:thioesterase domain-containing protein